MPVPAGTPAHRFEGAWSMEGAVPKVWPMRIGILGGTGPAGRGLAVRLAAAGDEVVLGSRDAERAVGHGGRPGRARGPITRWPSPGRPTRLCASADLVVMATPWDGAVATVKPLASALAGKVVVSMANALVKEGREFLALVPPRGSIAATLQAVLPESLLSASFHHLPASEMESLTTPMVADVLVCSDHPEATEATLAAGQPHRGTAGRRRREPDPGGGHRGVHRRAHHHQHPPPGPHRPAAGRIPRAMSGRTVHR